MNSLTTSPTTLGACVSLACIWEATAPKPGNVYRGADFEDLTYVDFLTSAAVIGPVLEQASNQGVGLTILEAARRTRATVATNTNLGMLLLLTPLAAVAPEVSLRDGITSILSSLTDEDATDVFEAIRTAQPGGLGEVEEADVNETATPDISLLDAMKLAEQRDLIAKQYSNGFEQVLQTADRIEKNLELKQPLSDSIVHAFLQLIADHPDSLIARKCGLTTAHQVSAQAANVLAKGNPGEVEYEEALSQFDFSLRIDGHRRNPGTSADLIAAALFVLLREQRLNWPVEFYRNQEHDA